MEQFIDVLKTLVTEDVRSKILEAERLENVESKKDPETDPYKSRYKSRDIYINVLNLLQDKLNQTSDKTDDIEKQIVNVLIAAVRMQIGMNYADTDETDSGCKELTKSLAILEDVDKLVKTGEIPTEFSAIYTNILQCLLNQIGIVWSGRSNYEEALSYLEKAQKAYLDYSNKVGSLRFSDLFSVNTDGENDDLDKKRLDNFEETYTNTLFYLAQVYGKLEQTEKSAKFCHQTLSRQLECGKYDPLDWALNAATLSQYYMTHGDFNTARHCLASATCIENEIETPPENLGPITSADSQAEIDAKEKIPRGRADIKRCWSKYGINLLEDSRNKLMSELQDTESTSDFEAGQMFPSIKPFNLESTAHENLITDKFVDNFSDARNVFLFVQKCLDSAKSFYVINNYCSDYIEIVQDQSKIYKLLAFFEPDMERQCKMHKRRIDMLSDLLNQVSQQHYLLVCRQLMYEIAETYSAMLDLKLATIEIHGKPPTAHAVKKINSLSTDSIEMYQKYLNTLKTQDKKYPEKFSDNDLRPALVAMFCMGRLYSKIIDFDVNNRLKNMKLSLDSYSFLVEYCDRNPESKDAVEAELDVCSEMVVLLPAKMDKVRAEAGY